jgi:hypothetical protein
MKQAKNELFNSNKTVNNPLSRFKRELNGIIRKAETGRLVEIIVSRNNADYIVAHSPRGFNLTK